MLHLQAKLGGNDYDDCNDEEDREVAACVQGDRNDDDGYLQQTMDNCK